MFDADVMLPAPGQGALAVETRDSGLGVDADSPLAGALRALDHRPTRLAVLAERALLARLEAGCAAPVGALAELDDEAGTLTLHAVVARTDGSAVLRRSAVAQRSGAAPDRAAEERAARSLGENLADLLLEAGAGDLAELGAGR